MRNWEYKVEELRATEDLSEETLNKLGAEGWELVSTVSDSWAFFREVHF